MALHGMQDWPRKKRRGRALNRGLPPPGMRHLLERDFNALEAVTQEVTDITETKTDEGGCTCASPSTCSACT